MSYKRFGDLSSRQRREYLRSIFHRDEVDENEHDVVNNNGTDDVAEQIDNENQIPYDADAGGEINEDLRYEVGGLREEENEERVENRMDRRQQDEEIYVYEENEEDLIEYRLEEEDEVIVDIEDEDEDVEFDDSDMPLYEGANITVSESMISIAHLFTTHNLTWTCVADLILAFNLHCLPSRLRPNSLHKFKKFFAIKEESSADITRHYYCSSCLASLQSVNGICQQCALTKRSYFLTLSLSNQLTELYKRPNFHQNLQHRNRREEREDNIINNGLLSNENNISLLWYTDGVPVFKSSQTSMWPVYITINELPFKERIKRKNMLLAGLWFGRQKLKANMFMQKLYSQFEQLRDGENFTLADGRIITVKAVLLFGTCDTPAEEQFLNMMQYNSYYGCMNCLHTGERVPTTNGGSTHVFRYLENIIQRSTEQTRTYAEEANRRQAPYMGVKGPSILSYIMPDYINGTAIDRMHCVDGGVVKKLLSLWFTTEYAGAPFSLLTVIEVINERLKSIKPPKYVHRMPKDIQDLLHWKTSEMKMWLFYYSLPVLYGIMENQFFQHYLLLVTGIAFLNTDDISDRMINTADNFLKKFVRDFELLYGLRFCSINIHMLLHLPNVVRNIGPLWTCSCYAYENFNGQFLKLIHGTGHIDTQVTKAHNQLLKLQEYVDQLPPGPLRDFCVTKNYGVLIGERLFNSCYQVGRYQFFDDIPTIVQEAVRPLLPIRNIKKYYRLLKDGQLYVCKHYSRSLQTLSSNIIYENNIGQPHFGCIHYFIKITDCNCTNICNCNGTHYAIVQNYTFNSAFQAQGNNGVTSIVPYLYRCTTTEVYSAVPIQFLTSVCISIDINGLIYIAIPVIQNTRE